LPSPWDVILYGFAFDVASSSIDAADRDSVARPGSSGNECGPIQDIAGTCGIQSDMKALLRIADRLAEPTVVLSYTSIGYGLRKPLWDDPNLDRDLTGRVMLITGANSGLGFATSHALAKRGATVILGCRNEQRGERARDQIKRETGNTSVHLEVVDVADLASVRAQIGRASCRERV